MKFERTLVSNFSGAFRGMRNPLNSWSRSDSVIDIGNLDDFLDAESDVIPCWIKQETPDIEYYSDKYEEKYQNYCDWIEANGILRNRVDTYDFALIGPKDMELAQRLIKSGPEHCKFLRQIQVSVDITAPLYWWKEFDTYKVGTTANSTSTMHTLAKTPITLDCFETRDYNPDLPVGMYCISGNNHEYQPEPDYNNLPHAGAIYNENNKIVTYINYVQNYSRSDFKLDSSFSAKFINGLERLRQLFLETEDVRYWKELIRWLPESFLQTRTVTMSYENLRNIYFQRRNHKLVEWREDFINWIKTLPYAKELIMLEEEK